MKKTFPLIVFLISLQFFGQNDQKTAFQKSKYELAISYYKKADFVKAIDLFSLAAKIKPENEIAQEAIKKVDTLREVLRKEILDQAVGTWKRSGSQPVWASTTAETENQSVVEELIEIKENQILFYEVDKKTKAKKLLKTEDLIYNDANNTVSLFSEIILSDGTIWNCSLNEKADVLHVINVAVKTEDGIEKIKNDNEESYYTKF
ncbi:tetratricopeptide repeat protein [Flavobacterium phragmitis]|uniref:Tetratricopeptide repeat-containing protein n=1 Tax=Flavobacterium phragmitis TaxID=739143 RepID=A0A1I1NI85_9FLAO|nr:tetratricopeptide repeat protein [Flavobacterium phragmitis]SFC96982.1 Tetratricopeptide repeat-containing protein [Flavobacterium phragmitis]